MFKITKSLAIILAAVAVIGGGTYAAWHDEASISTVSAISGSMDLGIDNDPASGVQHWVDNFTSPMIPDLQKLKPGFTSEQVIDIKNFGDVTANSTLKFVLTSNKDNTLLSPEILVSDTVGDATWGGELAQNMRVQILYSASNNNTDWVDLGSDTLEGLHNRVLALGGMTGDHEADGVTHITDGKVASVKLKWSIPSSAGNNIMTDSVTVDLVFGLDSI